jgi:hypothetical protein
MSFREQVIFVLVPINSGGDRVAGAVAEALVYPPGALGADAPARREVNGDARSRDRRRALAEARVLVGAPVPRRRLVFRW